MDLHPNMQKIVDTLQKIELLAGAMRMTLSMPEAMTAADWSRMGYMNAQLNTYASFLMTEMIGVTHDLYNPIPGRKLASEV